MSTYTQIYYHIVFGTKNRVRAIPLEHRREFLMYSTGVVRGLNCHLYQINCMEEHVHIFTSLHPSLPLDKFIKEFKVSTGKWMRGRGVFPLFRYWQEGYGGFTKSISEKQTVIEYIRDQDEHHKTETFLEEFKRLVEEAGLEWDERYLP